jgi:hypothetical protein
MSTHPHIISLTAHNSGWACTCTAAEVGAQDAFANAALHLRATKNEQ